MTLPRQDGRSPSDPWPQTRGLRILGITYGLASNQAHLIHNPEFWEPGEIHSQITNWCEIEPVPYAPGLDGYCYLLDDPALPFQIEAGERELSVQGDLSRLEREGSDRRWFLLGNLGLWFRWALAVQERRGIYSLHASSIYKPEENELLVIVGKAGAGKTVYLLESLVRGYQVLSTEMTFFRVEPERIVFYRGALMDNIRVGSFLYDFPEAAERLGLTLPQTDDPWGAKFSVSMHSVTTKQAELVNPKISFLFPRIETGYDTSLVHEIGNRRTLIRMLFESLSEKIGSTTLISEELPVTGLDSPALAQARWETVRRLVAAPHWHIKQAKNILAGPKSCMEGID
jgi:hypothetical protein